MTSRDLIVVGASLGGVETLRDLCSQLPADLQAAVVIVLHISAQSPSYLGEILTRAGGLPARPARDGEPLVPGQIYVPEPDRHLLVRDGTLRVALAPRENRCRPALDPLFRSAAVYGRSRTVGVVLSGLLDDGAQGLQAIRRCGGTTVVQSPLDALYGEMPQNALDAGDVDYSVPLAEMGALLADLVARPQERPVPPVPQDLLLETRLVEKAARIREHERDIEAAGQLGELVPVVCPECGGPLWSVQGQNRYRCHLGHAYGVQSLLSAQEMNIESAVWAGLRSLEERIKMLEGLARREHGKDRPAAAHAYEQRSEESRAHAQALRALLLSL